MISVTVRPALRVELRAPGLLEASPLLVAVHALVAGVEHRDQAHVGGALHVVLPAQRMQAGSGPPDVAGDRAQRDQAARVVGAGRVLGDPHAPEDEARARLAPHARHAPDQVRVELADLAGALGRVLLHGLHQRLVVRRAPLDEVAVDQVEPDQLVHQPVVEGHVRARLQLAEDVGVVGHLARARVDVDHRRAAPAGLLEERRGDWVVGRGVASGDDGHVGVEHVAVGGGHRARPDPLEERGDAGGVAEAGAVVDVVRVERRADQLLEEVGLLVRALGRAEAGDRARSPLGMDLAKAPRGQVQCLVPARLAEVGEHLVVVHESAGLVSLAAPLALHVRAERPLWV